jgi:hypothetical protein
MDEDYGRKIYQLLVGVVVVVCVVGALWLINRGGDEPAQDRATSCSSRLKAVVSSVRADDTSGTIDSDLEALRLDCPAQYPVFTDYISIKGSYEAGASGPCAEYRDYGVNTAAIRLASRDGFCN